MVAATARASASVLALRGRTRPTAANDVCGALASTTVVSDTNARSVSGCIPLQTATQCQSKERKQKRGAKRQRKVGDGAVQRRDETEQNQRKVGATERRTEEKEKRRRS